MALATMKEVLHIAKANHFACAAFEFWSFDAARVVTTAAQAQNVPVILQAGRIEAEHAGGYANLFKLAQMAIREVDIPVAVHLDHGEDLEQVRAALDAGFTSVMIDASARPFEENVNITCQVAELARPYGATVEAELGVLSGVEGTIQSETELQTKPEEAARFVE